MTEVPRIERGSERQGFRSEEEQPEDDSDALCLLSAASIDDRSTRERPPQRCSPGFLPRRFVVIKLSPPLNIEIEKSLRSTLNK